ncbi:MULTISPECIES: hypothetical protein [Paenibacillus]|uniref:hypothetical protein n=1 Tax=Paenibacillus TaxID=44249 RepID=UPI0022B882D8|nr:hypothetical protein [Paenibacillus caseinilyticus]MCZ8523564.1 hypothetical protein [Paenibacillus caseinilyticus]
MRKASQSMMVFGVYLLVLGTALFLLPGCLRELLGIEELPKVWLRFIGELLAFLGVYYVLAARRGWSEFFRLSVWLRGLVFISVTGFVLGHAMPALFFFIALVDLAGAAWTRWAIARETQE